MPHVVFLASSRSHAGRVRAMVADLCPDLAPKVSVVTIYGLAHSVTTALEERPPMLLPAARQDAHVRELLRGDSVSWPQELGQARFTDRFATQVREQVSLLSRLGLTPGEVMSRGRAAGREDWVGLGQFYEQYLATLALSGECDYVGLVSRACELLSQEDIIARFRPDGSLVLVDDAEDLDETHLRLVKALVNPTTPVILAADLDAQIDEFRGAKWRGLLEVVGHWGDEGQGMDMVVLPSRLPGAIASACADVRRRIPVPAGLKSLATAYRDLPRNTRGRVRVYEAGDSEEEIRLIADTVREFYSAGRAWEDMAVLVRKKSQVASFAQGLEISGVPVAVSGDEVRANQSGVVQVLLCAARWAVTGEQPVGSALRALAVSPLGGMDIASVSAVERHFSHVVSGEVPDHLAVGFLAGAQETLPLAQRVERARGSGDIHQVLWSLWVGSGWDQGLRVQAEGVGPQARMANRDLDAVGEMFRQASAFTGASAEAGLHGLWAVVASAEIPQDLPRPSLLVSRGVRVTTVHRAKGESWPLVVVAGVQSGVWPARGLPAPVVSLTGLDDRIDESGRWESAEMRLAWVACSCATQELVVTSVASGEDRPSAWVGAIRAERVQGLRESADPMDGGRSVVPAPKTPTALIAELRRKGGAGASPGLQAAARTRLVALARTDSEADPDSWWGVARSDEVGEEAPSPGKSATFCGNDVPRPDQMTRAGARFSFSPSTVEALLTCPRKWWLENRGGGARPAAFDTSAGSLFHRVIAENGDASATDLVSRLGEEWPSIAVNAPWLSAPLREKYEVALERFVRWRDRENKQGWHHMASEAGFSGLVDVANQSGEVHFTVALHGRIDWLESDDEGNIRVADFKTGKVVPTAAKAEVNVQLGIYQLAVAQGLIEFGEGSGQSWGADLVYVTPDSPLASGLPTVRHQGPLARMRRGGDHDSVEEGDGGVSADEESAPEDGWSKGLSQDWRCKIGQVSHYETRVHHQLAVACAIVEEGEFPALVNDGCRHCAVRVGCPLSHGRRSPR